MPRRGIDLSEEQWRKVKTHASSRGQTLSEYVGDLVDEVLGDGTIRPATTMAKIDPGFGYSRPAPKPKAKR